MPSNKRIFAILLIATLFFSCRPTRYVADNEYLVRKVTVQSDVSNISSSDSKRYIRQLPNSRVIGIFPIKLGIYNNHRARVERRLAAGKKVKDKQLGEAPVIYNAMQTEVSLASLKQYAHNKGYFDAEVSSSIDTTRKKKRAYITYNIKGNEPYKINDFNIILNDEPTNNLLNISKNRFQLKQGINFDTEVLDNERSLVSNYLRNNGYYYFDKNYLYYDADSSRTASHWINLNLLENKFERRITRDSSIIGQEIFKIRDVYYYVNFDPQSVGITENIKIDTLKYDDINFLYKDKIEVRPKILALHTFLLPNQIFRQRNINRTYSSINRMGYFGFLNIQTRDVRQKDTIDGLNWLDCHVSMLPVKAQSFSIDLEGTNSAGDFGIASNISYMHRNIFKGTELFKLRFRVAYENLSNATTKLINFSSIELLGEATLFIPHFLFPFIDIDKRRELEASSEAKISYSYLRRPYYTRNIASLGMKYTFKQPRFMHYYDLIDIDWVFLPWIDEDFQKHYLGTGSLIRYSYEDHFIMRTGYSFVFSQPTGKRYLGEKITIKAGTEIAGNILYGIYKAANIKQEDGSYKIFKISFSQYVKGDFDFSYKLPFDTRNQLVFHGALGIAYPYGNSKIIPFEKRYYGGGANSVRGWSVRTLGPGTYKGSYDKRNGAADYMNQVGDIKLDLNLEYRLKLFWKLEGAIFVDAGNVWTIHEYNEQPGGVFKASTFFKQIALGYGLGIRADFNYFLVRFDWGFKAYDPGRVDEEWRFKNVTFKKDMAMHFAIGYPF